MIARLLSCLVVCACACARVQPQARIYLEVPNETDEGEIEKRYTPELVEELDSVKSDALLLYTEYTSAASTELKAFLKNISCFNEDVRKSIDRRLYECAPEHCRAELWNRLKKIEYDAHRAASFSAENHHKFFLGHMVVFRIHLNKSEEYVNRCEKVYRTCGVPCETTPRQKRWRQFAMNELNRVKDDIVHSRRSYKDLLMHSKRRLNHFYRLAKEKANVATRSFETCSRTK